MEIEHFLESLRDHYLEAYRKVVREYSRSYSHGGPELLLETKGDKDYVYRLYRIDLASGTVDSPDLFEVNPESFLNFETQQFVLDGMKIQFSPIHWNGVEFEISTSVKDDSSLQQWALKWIDPEDTAITDDHGLGNYVHSITTPVIVGATLSFSVDFGSSEIDAFIELLELLAREGVRTVNVHSHSTIDC